MRHKGRYESQKPPAKGAAFFVSTPSFTDSKHTSDVLTVGYQSYFVALQTSCDNVSCHKRLSRFRAEFVSMSHVNPRNVATLGM